MLLTNVTLNVNIKLFDFVCAKHCSGKVELVLNSDHTPQQRHWQSWEWEPLSAPTLVHSILSGLWGSSTSHCGPVSRSPFSHSAHLEMPSISLPFPHQSFYSLSSYVLFQKIDIKVLFNIDFSVLF